MAIVMHLHQGNDEDRSGPVVICDHCGQRIESARDGNVEWQVDAEGRPTAGGAIFFTHKDCCRAFETAARNRWYTQELSAFLVYLGNGLHVSWREARRVAALLASV